MKLSSSWVITAVFAGLFTATASAGAATPYAPTIHGSIAGFRLAGVEPDGDPLDQVALKTKLSASGLNPQLNLIVSSYLENFRPDTTPILPDLLHPSRTAANLGGFLQGKALVTDDAGNVVIFGDFLAEALLNDTNHAVVTFYGPAPRYSPMGGIKGIFSLQKDGSLSGQFTGSLKLTKAQKMQLAASLGAHMKPLKQIISVVNVVPHYYGTKGVKGTGSPLHTGFGSNKSPRATVVSGNHASGLSFWTWLAGAGAILCLVLAGALYLVEKRRAGMSEASSA